MNIYIPLTSLALQVDVPTVSPALQEAFSTASVMANVTSPTEESHISLTSKRLKFLC
jgi:hypothetical protein